MSQPLLIIVAAIITGSASLGALFGTSPKEEQKTMQINMQEQTQSHPYVGMWVTEDGHVRHDLLANGRYDEARGKRQSAYQGRYVVTGTHIDYWDDTGFTADGEFVSADVLHHGGMVFYRRK
jgi:hypothetical protein